MLKAKVEPAHDIARARHPGEERDVPVNRCLSQTVCKARRNDEFAPCRNRRIQLPLIDHCSCSHNCPFDAFHGTYGIKCGFGSQGHFQNP